MAEEQFVGPYRLEEVIGQGGMGQVWRARDTRMGDRVVALKVLPPALAADPEFRARFNNEADRAAGLQSPHIIPVHSYGEADGRLYIEMPLARGTDLDKLLVRDGPLAPSRAVRIVTQVARALDVAHERGLVHRDVKPANVLVVEDSDDFAYLVDFGIAKPMTGGTALTGTAQAIGSLDYMAPERFEGETDVRGDVYALAGVLHALLTGQAPFDIRSAPQAVHAHVTLPPPRPSQVRDGLDPAFDAVVAVGMAKRPEQRYRSAGALAEAAGHALTAAQQRGAVLPGHPPQGGAPSGVLPTPSATPQSSVPTHVPGAGVTPPTEPTSPDAGKPGGGRRRRSLIIGASAAVLLLVAAVTVRVVTDDGAIDRPSLASLAPVTPGQVVRVPTGTGTQGSPTSPDGRLVYTANRNARSLSVIDAATNTRRPDIPLAGEPTDVAVHPDGESLYVALPTGVEILNAETNAKLGFVPIDGTPYDVEVSPDGRTFYASLFYARAVAEVDIQSRALTRVPVGDGPQQVVVSRDSSTVYVVNSNSGTVSVLDAEGPVGPPIPVGARPRFAALTSDGASLWVVNEGSGSVSVVDTGRSVVSATLDGLANPQGIAFSPDDGSAYVSNYNQATVVPYDIATRQPGPPLLTGYLGELAVAPDGSRLYGTDFTGGALVVVGLAQD